MVAFLILFNQRQSGEVGKMLLKNYVDAKEADLDYDKDEAFQTLTAFERKIAQSHLLIKLIGKKDRHVPLLLPSFMEKSMDLLVNPPSYSQETWCPYRKQILVPCSARRRSCGALLNSEKLHYEPKV